MKNTGIKTHLLLNRDFGAADMSGRKHNVMPAPLCNLILSADHPLHVATCTLLEGSLRYYPLEVEDFLIGETLRVHYKCFTRDRTINTRFTREELDVQERQLAPFADEVVASWNIVQLRTAKILMDNAPRTGRAVSMAAIEAIHRAPHSFYAALTCAAAPALN